VLEHGKGISYTVYVVFVVPKSFIPFYTVKIMGGGEDRERNLGRFLRGSSPGRHSTMRPSTTAASAAMRLVTGFLSVVVFVSGVPRPRDSRVSCECGGEWVLCVVRVSTIVSNSLSLSILPTFFLVSFELEMNETSSRLSSSDGD